MAENLIIATTPEEAFKAFNASASYMAGGTEVNRLGSSVEGETLISIRRIPALKTVEAADGRIRIGACCTFQELEDNELIPDYLKEALLFMASRTRRNMATIGGNIALCRDDSFLIPTLTAAGAELELLSEEGISIVTLGDYISSAASGCSSEEPAAVPRTALITRILLPAEAVVVSKRHANTAHSHARLTVALGYADGSYTAACAIKNGGIHQMKVISAALNSDPDMSEEAILKMVRGCDGLSLEDDLLYGSADYRKYLLGVTVSMLRYELQGRLK